MRSTQVADVGSAMRSRRSPTSALRWLVARQRAVEKLGRGEPPRRLLDHRGLGQRVELGLVDAGEAARADEHAGLERSGEAVVAVDGALDRPAQVVGVRREAAEPLVELVAELEQRARLLRDVLLRPGVGDGLEDRPEVHRRGERDALAERVVEQRGILFERRGEQRLARHEAHDELGARRQTRPVRLLGQRVDVRAHGLDVLVEQRRGAARPRRPAR